MATVLGEAALTLRAENGQLRRGLGGGGAIGIIRGFASKATSLINPVTEA